MKNRTRWRFGPFEADPLQRQLRRDGVLVPLRAKPFALLTELLMQPAKVVSKADLFATVWAGRVVTDAALSRTVHQLRLALADDATDPRYIETVHALGFRFIAPLSSLPVDPSTRSEGPPPKSRTAGRVSHLVGREAQLAQLDEALNQAQAGQRQAVFVTGEAGIGKTALVEAFVARCAAAGVLVAQGRCIQQYGEREPFLPVLEMLEQLAGQMGLHLGLDSAAESGADALREVLVRYAPAWLAQLPWLAHGTSPAAGAQAMAGITQRQLLRELAQALEVVAARAPLVLWWEDLHWSDHSSLEALSFLAGRRDSARILVIASFRPGFAQSSDMPLPSLVRRLSQQAQASMLALQPLDADAVETYLGKRLAGGLASSSRELPAFIYGRTDGHALFTVSMVDDLVQRRQLVPGPQGWALVHGIEHLSTVMPESMRQLLLDQLAQLSEPDRWLIEAAAVAGTEFCAAAVAAALEQETADVEQRCVHLAQAGGLLGTRPPVRWPDGVSSAGFAFRHALYWQGVYEQLPHSRRGQWQHRIALREEEAWGEQRAQIAAELAMRFEAAHELPRCVHYLLLAGGGALQRCAYLESASLLQHALDMVPQLPTAMQPGQELALRLPLGAALMAAQGYAADEVLANYERALVLCRSHGQTNDLDRVLRGVWNVALVRANLRQALAVGEELLLRAQGSPGRAFDAHAKLGETFMHLGRFADARDHLERALALPLAADDPARLREAPRVLAYLSWVLWYTGDPTQACACGEQALVQQRDATRAHTRAFVCGFLAFLFMFLDDKPRARELAGQQLRVSVEHDLNYWRIWSELTCDLLEMDTVGDAQPPLRLARLHRAVAEFGAMSAQVGVPHFLCLVGAAELAAGHPEQARLALSSGLALSARTGNAYSDAELLRLQGEAALADADDANAWQRAAVHFDAAAQRAHEQGARILELRATISRARLWAHQGHPARARALLEPLVLGMENARDSADAVLARACLEAWREAALG
jgi:DNA-binding winged helix-turn-helix (wHTH) protein/tetratricopeptide (TPR) repeat protein